jgi:hypothetical protein
LQKYEKILVISPGNISTGGVECLHYLVHILRSLGEDARIVYFPFNRDFMIPSAYKDYDICVGKYEDVANQLIIVPEIYPLLANQIKLAQPAIWWLSVDNYLERRHTNFIRDKIRFFKRVLKGQRPFFGVKQLSKRIHHYCQSYYAFEFLSENGISSKKLYEPINQNFLDLDLSKFSLGLNRANEILFNPVKGKKITDFLIKKFPNWKFTPLKNMTRSELSAKFLSAKIYIDFGHHPGRDKLPREAAIQGCCLITGILGSAQNDVDIPIPRKYKIDVTSLSFEYDFEKVVSEIFSNYNQSYQDFSTYHLDILSQTVEFRKQLSEILL